MILGIGGKKIKFYSYMLGRNTELFENFCKSRIKIFMETKPAKLLEFIICYNNYSRTFQAFYCFLYISERTLYCYSGNNCFTLISQEVRFKVV